MRIDDLSVKTINFVNDCISKKICPYCLCEVKPSMFSNTFGNQTKVFCIIKHSILFMAVFKCKETRQFSDRQKELREEFYE